MDEADQHAERVNRTTNDPARIEKRKEIAPAFAVRRSRGDRMAEVLARRNYETECGGDWDVCPKDVKPGWLKDAQLTLDFLAATGFGDVAKAKAEGLGEAAAVVGSEESDQWRMAEEYFPGSQIVAQRMQVIGKVINARAATARGES